MMSRSLLAVALVFAFATTATAQTFVPIKDAPVATSSSASSTSVKPAPSSFGGGAECGVEQLFTQDAVTAAGTSTAGGPQEILGQSFVAECDGVLSSFIPVVQFTDTQINMPNEGILRVYEGAGTSGSVVMEEAFTFTGPPAAGAYRFTFAYTEGAPVTAGQTYTILFDQSVGSFGVQVEASAVDIYAGGSVYGILAGGTAGDAVPLTFGGNPSDLRFQMVYNPGEAGGPTIADARAAAIGTEVTFSGVVTRARGAFTYLQDNTAGITIRQTSGTFFDDVASGAIAPGTQVTITGTTSEFNGLFQINAADLASYTIDGTTDVPDAQVITLAELMTNGENYEGELVSISDLTTDAAGVFAASTNYDVTDATGAGQLRVVGANDSDVDGTDIPEEGFTFEGVIGQFNGGAGDTGYQLLAIDADDVTADPPPPAGTVAEAGDAPNGLTGTQDATGATTVITGQFNDATDEADCYAISIADIDAFSVTTQNGAAGQDTQLQLFTSALGAVAFNDDSPLDAGGASGDFRSTIPAGALTGRGLTAGDYTICVTDFNTQARNAAGELIYSGTGRTVRVPDAPSGDFVLADWTPSVINPGSYQMDLTGTGDGPPPPSGDITFSSEAREDLQVPSSGDFVRFTIEMENATDDAQQADVWATATMIGETEPFFVRRARTFTVPAMSTVRSGYFQRVPDYVPDGMYTITIYAGEYNDKAPATPTAIYGSDAYTITKGDTAPLANDGELKAGLEAYGSAWYLAQRGADKAVAIVADASAWTESDFTDVETIALTSASSVTTSGVQVGPNPVQGQARFAFDVSSPSEVSLVVYDVLGREVQTLVSGRLEAGSHTAQFDATRVPAGTYVYRLTSGREVTTGRLTVVR